MKTKTLALGGIAVVAAAVAAAIWLRPLPEVDIAVPSAAVASSAQEVGDAIEVDPPQQSMPSEISPEVADAEPEVAEVELAIVAPVRTDFRFEPDGSWLVSGQAASGVPLAVMVDGAEVERVDVGADGSFLALGALGFSDSPRVMHLISDPDGAAVVADQTFVLAANPAPVVVAEVEEVTVEPVVQPEPSAERVIQSEDVPAETAVVAEVVAEAEVEAEVEGDVEAEVEAELEGDVEVEGEGDVEVTVAAADESMFTSEDEAVAIADVEDEPDTAQQTAPTPAAPTPAAPTPAAPAILAVTEDGVEVVQPAIAADTPPEVMANVALDTITYDPEGEVVLGGRAVGEGFVQVYVDNTPVSRLSVDADGTWRGDLPDVDKGVYTLRIDEVDVEGTVVSRIETPFLREDPADVVEAMADDVANPQFTVATRTVQPGSTLWAIAEERYGAGVLYVNVFEANRDRIRDPDLIYPGQVFVLPETEN